MIYKDRIAWKKFPRFLWRDGDRLFSILWGINLSGGKVEPVYLAIVNVWKGGGYLNIEFPKLLIAFRRRKPWVQIQRTKKLIYEVSDDKL